MKELKPARTSFMDLMRSKIFAIAWTVNVISSVGTHIHHTSEKLQMAQLTDSTLFVALLDSANTLPVFILGLSAGAIADILDRRKLLIATQTFMLICAAILSILTFLHITTPTILLIIAFLIGIGSAFGMPAYQAIVPELIERRHLIPDGIIINSVGYNLSRTIGPALGGVIFHILGASWAFCINAVSFISVIVALITWNRYRIHKDATKAEPIIKAMSAGFKHVRTNKDFQDIILWAVGYGWFGSIIFSLLPAFIMQTLKVGDLLSGILLSCAGVGAVMSMFTLRPLRQRFEINSILVAFGIMTAICHAILVYTSNVAVIAICMILAGMSWLSVVSTVNTVIQLSVPVNIKARAFGIYHTIWGGTMSMGAIFWGNLGVSLGTRTAIGISAAGIVMVLFILNKIKIIALDRKAADTDRWAVL